MPKADTANLVVIRHHDPIDRAAIAAPLIAFNLSQVHAEDQPPLAILIKDPITSGTIGGLWGHFVYDWLSIEMLVVPEQLRGSGVGRDIMNEAEAVAKSEGCIGVWVDTFAFQAAGFYRKLGYTQFGTIEDHPRGKSRLFFQKRLDAKSGFSHRALPKELSVTRSAYPDMSE